MEVFFNNTLYKGTKTSWSSTVKNPKLFDELDAFISNNKNEYIICFYSYDLKNNIEDLSSSNKDNIKFPDIHCFVPNEIHNNYSIGKEKKINQEIEFQSDISKEEYLKFLYEMGLEYNVNEPFNGTDLTVEVGEELFDSEKLRVQVTQKIKGAGVEVICNRKTTKEDFDD